MIDMPFNKWTLLFKNEEYETKFEIENNQHRIVHYRFFGMFTMILCAIFFVIYALEEQPFFVVLSMAAIFILIGVGVFNLKRLESHLRILLTAANVMAIGVNLYMATIFQSREALYIYGMSCSSISGVMFLYSSYKLRIFITLFAPTIQLYVMEMYTAQNVKFIIFHFSTSIILAVYAHYNEYMLRVAFSYRILNEKFKNIIQQFVPQSLFAISLNPQTNQFDLRYQNLKAKEQFDIEDTKSMVEIIRNIYVFPQNQSDFNALIFNPNIQNEQLIKRILAKQQTLEEYAFYKVKNENFDNHQLQQLDGIFYTYGNESMKFLSIELLNIYYGKNVLVIAIQEQYENRMAAKEAEYLKFLKKIIKYIGTQLYISQQKCFKAIQQLGTQEQSESILNLKCLNLFSMNQFQNYFTFLNQQQIHKELKNISEIQLERFIQNFEIYLSQAASNASRKFNLYFDISDILIKTSSKFLSQIIINVFETALELSNQNSSISLTITKERNLNPLQEDEESYIKISQYGNPTEKFQESSSESQILQEKQQLIKFTFSFKTFHFVELQSSQKFIMNPTTLEEFALNNSQELKIPYFITNFLLERIGPYNQTIISQSPRRNHNYIQFSESSEQDFVLDEYEVYQNNITFYIYTDQTQLTQSFLKCVRQKSFLND